MSDLKEIQRIWTMPDGWSVRVGGKHMEVLDLDGEVVAQTMTQISVIETIQKHLETQDSIGAAQMLMTSLKNPIEG